jgi:hypothetical protein
MPYRKVTINGETFETRLSIGAVMEWLDHRHPSYPNRPPDIDTPELRGWVSHPGENKDDPHFMERDRAKSESGMVYAVTAIPRPLTKDVPDVLKLIVTCDGDEYTFTMKGLYDHGQGEDFAGSHTTDADDDPDEALEGALRGFAMLIQPNTVMVVTSLDMDRLEDELDKAERDIAEYFGDDTAKHMVH